MSQGMPAFSNGAWSTMDFKEGQVFYYPCFLCVVPIEETATLSGGRTCKGHPYDPKLGVFMPFPQHRCPTCGK